MQKDFLEPNGGLWIGHSTTQLQEEVEKLAKAFHSTYPDGIVIFTQDSHKENSIEFNQFPKHCIQDTEGGDALADLFPIGDLFKSEVYQLLDYFVKEGMITEDLIDRVPSAGLWEGQTDEQELGYTYNEMEPAIIEIKKGGEIGQLSHSKVFHFVEDRHRKNKHKHEAPAVFALREHYCV